MPCTELAPEQKNQLLALARESINYGQQAGKALEVDCAQYPGALRQKACSFVTLHLYGQLRGCIGALEATMPLVQDVAEHAFSAAYRDPRFQAVNAHELGQIKISISVLTAPQRMPELGQQELLEVLEAGQDGLVLEQRDADNFLLHKATYLPSVWQQLPDKAEFLASLKQKAGLPADYWSEQLRFWRYRTLSFSED